MESRSRVTYILDNDFVPVDNTLIGPYVPLRYLEGARERVDAWREDLEGEAQHSTVGLIHSVCGLNSGTVNSGSYPPLALSRYQPCSGQLLSPARRRHGLTPKQVDTGLVEY